jgi:hypothetical protein
MSDNLKKKMIAALYEARHQTFQEVAALGVKEIFSARMTEAEQQRLADSYARVADQLLQDVLEAGYSLPPEGDLRAQLTKFGRELKAEAFYQGYSNEPDKIAEAKCEVKSEIGIAILSALGVA